MNMPKARLCSLLSDIVYYDGDNTINKIKSLGFDHIKFFNKDSSQGYVIHDTNQVYVVFRGTELREIKDILRNSMFWPTREQKQGKVHSGFASAIDEIWDDMNSYLNAEVEQHAMHDAVAFAGHSLGGAMAIIGAARSNYIAEVYTFGSPRTGNKNFHNNVRSRMYRIINEHDIIPLILPPIGYHHGGVEYRMHNNVIHTVTSYWDSWKWQLKIGAKRASRFRWVRSLFADHSSEEYVKHLNTAKSDT